MTHHVIRSDMEVSFRGVPYGYLDRTGRLPIWNVLRLLGNGYFILNPPKDSSAFVHQITKIEPDLYRDVNLFSKFHLCIENRFVDLRKFSFVVQTRLRNLATGQNYVLNFSKRVCVDRDSQKPLPISGVTKHLHNKYSTSEDRAPEAIHVRTFPAEPEVNVYKIRVTVSYSDLNVLFHTNYTNYVKFCIDCATSAALDGFYKHFTDEMCWFPVEEVDIHYTGDSKAKDELIISTWQNESNIRNIFFIITLRGEAICKASLLFSMEKIERMLEGNL